MTCPRRCCQPTVVPNGQVTNLPKNYAVVEIVHEKKERSSSFSLVAVKPRARSTSVPQQLTTSQTTPSASSVSSLTSSSTSNISNNSSADDYKCDVCEVLGATVVCPSCAVCLCFSCSKDIHSRKGYQLHHLITLSEFINSPNEIFSSQSGSLEQRSTDILDGKQCKLHSNELLEYACKSCGEIVCKMCLHSGEHKDHDCRLLAEVAMEKKEELRQAIDDVNQCYTRWNDGFDKCEELQEHMFDIGRTLESSIKSHFHNIHSSLHAKEEQVLGLVRNEVDTRMKQLKQQAE